MLSAASDPSSLLSISRYLAAILWVFAGLGFYLVLTNRLLSYLSGPLKFPFLITTFTVLVGGFGLLGVFSGGSVWSLIPVLILVWLAFGQLRLGWTRKRVAGSPPVGVNCRPSSLRRPFTTTDLCLYHYKIKIKGWHGPGIRIAHLSDLHISDKIPLEYYCRAVSMAAQQEPDLMFYTGDFVTDLEHIHLLRQPLAQTKSRLGTFAILGNHDYWSDPVLVEEVVRSSGIHVLRDDHFRIQMEDGSRILIVGCERPWSRREWVKPDTRDGELTLALAHTGDQIYRLSKAGACAVFSGHYHAGQFHIPGIGPLVVPSAYGRRFYHGHFLVNGTHLFVSAGIGAAQPSFRIYCQPDIFIIDIQPD